MCYRSYEELKKKIYRMTNIFLCLIMIGSLTGCIHTKKTTIEKTDEWKDDAITIKTYGYYDSFPMMNNNYGFENLRPFAVVKGECTYLLINKILYKYENGALEEIYDTDYYNSGIVGATDDYLYLAVGLSAYTNVYRYSFENSTFEEVFSSQKTKEEYGDSIGSYIWIDGDDCLLTTFREEPFEGDYWYCGLYIFSDDNDMYVRYEINDETEEINEKYKCQLIEEDLFITDMGENWFVEYSGNNDKTVACNNHVLKSGEIEVLPGYESDGENISLLGAYSWNIYSYKDKVIYPITGARIYRNNYLNINNTSTMAWRYDAIDIYDTTSDERYTLYVDGVNRIIGYDPEENRVFLYVYSDNTLISKDLDDDTLVSLESFEEAAAISFVWEGKDLFYFYGTGDDMRYGGIIDVAK